MTCVHSVSFLSLVSLLTFRLVTELEVRTAEPFLLLHPSLLWHIDAADFIYPSI